MTLFQDYNKLNHINKQNNQKYMRGSVPGKIQKKRLWSLGELNIL